MSAKVSLRLPEHLMQRLREESRVQGLSLNETVVDAILVGLGEDAPRAGWRCLGDLVALPPERPYDAAAFARLRESVAVPLDGFMEALEWARGEP